MRILASFAALALALAAPPADPPRDAAPPAATPPPTASIAASPGPAAAPAAGASIHYPPARRGDVVDDYFGTKIADPYRWLEDDRSEETGAWVKAENEVARAFLDAVPERAAIRGRLARLWDYERFANPARKGGRYFWERNSGLQNQSVLWVAEAADAPGRVLLDPNALSADGTVALVQYDPSEDGRLLAYALSEAGSDWQTWHVRRVDTGEDLPDLVRWSKFGRAAWRKDGSGFYYARFAEPVAGEDPSGVTKNQQIWFHRVGTAQSEDALVYARPDQPEWYLDAEVSEDGRWLVLTASKGTNPETALFVADLSRPGSRPEPFLDRMDATYSFVHASGDSFLVLTNQGAPRYRLVAIRRGAPAPEAWRTVVPEGPGRDVLDGARVIGGRIVVTWMRDARNAVEIHDLAGRRLRAVTLPSLGTVTVHTGRSDDPEGFLSFEGFTSPRTIYRLDARTGRTAVFKQPRVAFDAAAYVTRQVFFRSKDGTRVPMFLVHRKGLRFDGASPALLNGYGGFNIAITPRFSVARAVWLEMGGVVAVANLRGGGEYGKAWYDAGRLDRKQNVFDDFIAAAEWLVRNGVTSSPRLAVEGASNGGLLVGAVLTQRPELFGAAIPEVGVLDMLRFQRFTVGWGWTSDYGSSETKEGFDVLVRYSPLQAIRPGTRYPATLVVTADHDDRVVPAHSFKFTAALQAAQSGPAPILARIETRAGHGAGKPTAKLIEERADVYAFLVRALGMTLPPGFGSPGGGAGETAR
jgi:prolyl oligopeptidase